VIGAFIENVVEAYLRPRKSVRRLLDGGHGPEAAYLMVVLAYALDQMFAMLVPGSQAPTDGVPIGLRLIGLLMTAASFLIFSLLVFGIGGRLGGKGTLIETLLTLGWYEVATSVIRPLTLPAQIHLAEAMRAADGKMPAQVEIPFTSVAMFLCAGAVMLWLLACFVAELHRFRHTWSVLSVMLAISAAIGAIAMSLSPGT